MSGVPSLVNLRRLLARDQTRGAGNAFGEPCQRCGASLPQEHRHIANLETRALACICDACYATALGESTTEDQHRTVPRRYVRLPSSAITEDQWDALEIPVGIAFFFHNSAIGRIVASYPSPAGATESLLPAEIWEQVLRSTPSMRMLTPDVEALLVRRTADVHDCFLVPIDACYELAGRIRRGWRGFGGGPEVREEIDSYFAMLRDRSEPATP